MRKEKKKRHYVVDSHAILTYLHQDAGWQEVGKLLRFWRRKRIRAKLNWLNWERSITSLRGTDGREKALEAMDFVAAYPLELER